MSCCEYNIVEISDLSFAYDRQNPALENVSLQIGCGESASIIGPNGGGKSTLLKLMLGLLTPQCGTIRIFGVRPEDARLKIGYMPQYHQLDASFPISAGEVVLQGTLHKGFWGRYSREALQIANEAMEEMAIGHLAKRSFAALSGGQRQRVLIARALASRPGLLLLDEPTANIDPGAEEQFYATLSELRRRMSIVTVSHDLGFVNRETDHVICVNKYVSVHPASQFDQHTADQVYRHSVNLIQHDHACFCGCGHKNADGEKF